MKPPRKAFILAAGLGTRLRPLTHHTPKPLVPVWGKPALLLTLQRLKRWGVQDVVINVNSHPDQFHRLAKEAQHLGLCIELSFEPIVLDTGGALRKAAWFLDKDPFWLVNGDIVFDVSPRPFLKAFEQAQPPLAALWCTDQRGPRTVELNKGQVVCFRSKAPKTAGTYTFCGLHLVSPRILSFIPESGPYSIIDAYSKAMADGEHILGIDVQRQYWADLGTVESYIATHRDLAEALQKKLPGADLVDPSTWRYSRSLPRKGINIQECVVADPKAIIERGAALTNAIIWSGTTVRSNARLSSAVVAGTSVSGPNESTGAILSLEHSGFPAALRADLLPHGFSNKSTVIPFPPRGSARSFYRVQHDTHSAILIRYETSRAENALHAGHTQFLQQAGIRVPALLADHHEGQWCLMEDCGDTSLLSLAKNASPATQLRLYKQVIDGVAKWHSSTTLAGLRHDRVRLAPAFTPALYRWEHDLFMQHFAGSKLATASHTASAIRCELGGIAKSLGREPLVLLHRDLQSSNVLFSGNKPVFIDYQGMRLGTAMYDIASLLADPYVSLSMQTQRQLLSFYAEKTGQQVAVLLPFFWMATVQRLCQALGAYGRLTALGLDSFKAHIQPALIMLDRALAETDNEPVLKSFVRSSISISAGV